MLLTLKEFRINNPGKYSFLFNTRTAFLGKSDKELKSSLFLFNMISMPWLIRIGSYLLNKAISMRLPVKGIVKRTLFRHFCGGENISEAIESMNRLKTQNVYTVLDYAAEEMDEERDFDQVAHIVRENILLSAKYENLRFISIKPSGLGNSAVLEKAAAGGSVNPDEARSLELFRLRLLSICSLAAEKDVTLYIDAEETWLQEPVDTLALDMMKRFNRTKALIFNTYQMYRRDRLPVIMNTLDQALQDEFIPGIKIVRGAYIEKETQRALEMDYPNPVYENKTDTDLNFNEAIFQVLSHPCQAVLCVATHNEESTQLALELQTQLDRPGNCLQFSQLYGMSDHLTYNLAAKGYISSKYLPYGRVDIAIPYLLRRARENSSIGKQSNRDRQLIISELKRRKDEKQRLSICRI